MTTRNFEALVVPVATPFAVDGAVDAAAFTAHCHWLLAQGARGLAIFGTTSEANSLSVAERLELLQAALAGGIPPRALMPGTGACALPDAVVLTAAAVGAGCGGVLVLPPFYYKAVTDEGLFAFYAELIERTGSDALRLYLYHIPPVAQVGIGFALIERLLARFPGAIAGIKDSSGDWEHTRRLNETFPQLEVFCGSETFLLANLRAGGAGCITATGNVNPAAIARLCAQWQASDADAQQAALTHRRKLFEGLPPIAAVKCALAEIHGRATWQRPRPPLLPLSNAQREQLLTSLRADGMTV